ncbi:MAG: hypothetical protein PUB13_05950 [Lachnospiraceae bacterium]|nr:hypothetical protein [Lachnospiraceae bacterium]
MLKLKLMNKCDGKIVFNYYPEGKSDFGTVSINEKTGEIDIMNVAQNDEFGRYKIHAINRIKEYFENKKFVTEDIVAWY